eukprot:1331657-Amorphochlora_amoeboformis.AAC.1
MNSGLRWWSHKRAEYELCFRLLGSLDVVRLLGSLDVVGLLSVVGLLGNNLDGSWVVGLLGNLDGIGVLGNNQQACGVCQGPLASEGGSIHQRQRYRTNQCIPIHDTAGIAGIADIASVAGIADIA